MQKRFLALAAMAVLVLFTGLAFGQAVSGIKGTVTDQNGAAVVGAKVTATSAALGVERSATTASAGEYDIPSLPPGSYTVTVQVANFQQVKADNVIVDISQTVVQNFDLKVASASEVVTVEGTAPVIEAATITQGQVIDQQTVQEVPLNGRHFVDLGLLAPGTVTPPANGFLTAPLRGQGSFAINTAGTREDQVNFMINGVNLNDMANGQLTYQPSISTVSEFKLDNSSYSADEGRNSGAIVNIATRSGTNSYHGEAFDYIRNDFFDSRNFFNKVGTPMSPFKKNNFGVSFGGPIRKDKTFFFLSYEAVRQRQGLTLSTNVLTDGTGTAGATGLATCTPAKATTEANQRACVTDPTSLKLLALIPHPNDSTGSVFNGSAVAPVDIDQGTADISHNFSGSDRVHGYYAFQRDIRKEPTTQGGTVPGAGDTRQSHRQVMTISESHVFSPTTVNEARLGYNRIHIVFAPDNNLDPTSFGISDGLSGAVGIPQISIGQTGITFGGIGGFPQGRGDYTAILSDTLSHLVGRHAFKFGGEVRRFDGNSFTGDDGTLPFSSIANFQSGNVTSFNINLGGNHPVRVYDNAFGLFAVDSFKASQRLTLELGLRWDWNMSPTEASNRSSFFNPATDTLVPFNSPGYTQTIQQNNKLFQPRLGFVWDAFGNNKVVVRSGYGLAYDQPLPGPFVLNGNPPFSLPVSLTTTSTYGTLLTSAGASTISLTTVDPHFKDAYVQSYNLNVESQITPTFGMMVGYFGNKGTHMEIDENINPIIAASTNPAVAGLRVFPALDASSPIDPGVKLANITQRSSNGYSNYNALWVTSTKRVSHGLTFNTSYTWSRAMDLNSRNFQGVVLSNPFDATANYGPSDYDARQRFVISGVYDVPWKHNSRFLGGWEVSPIVQLQTGNPLNVVSGSPVGGQTIGNFQGSATVRPDLLAPVTYSGAFTSKGQVQWFSSTVVCDPRAGACPAGALFAVPVTGPATGAANVFHFGNLGHNALLGPGFEDIDFSLQKSTKITERFALLFRADAFDLFNHPNFGNPGLTATPGSTTFGIITSTRVPTGDSGSSRQIQLSLKLRF